MTKVKEFESKAHEESVKNTTSIILILSNVIYGISLLPAFVFILISPMLFDNPNSTKQLSTIILAASILSYPILVIVSIILGWTFYKAKGYIKARWIVLIPLIALAAIVIIFAI